MLFAGIHKTNRILFMIILLYLSTCLKPGKDVWRVYFYLPSLTATQPAKTVIILWVDFCLLLRLFVVDRWGRK